MAGRKRKRNTGRAKIALLISRIVFFVSVLFLCRDFMQGKKEEAAFSKLKMSAAESVQDENDTASGRGSVENGNHSSDTVSQEYRELLKEAAGFAALKEQNHDYAGWISVPGTSIDYPVMDRKDDPEYYLHRAFDGTKTLSGTPFLGELSDPDSTCFIIYGHHMKNGTMFGKLELYQKKEYWTTHPEIYFFINGEIRVYEIFASVRTEISEKFPYYHYEGMLFEEEYRTLCSWILEHSIYNTGLIPENMEQIMILSTCSYHTENGRFLVAARKKNGS